MRFTIKKIEEIKKALSSIEDSLVNSYLKVGTKKYYVHKNSLYTDPNFTKIAGHFQNGMAMLQHKRKMTLSRRSKKSKNILSNVSNVNKGSNNRSTMNKIVPSNNSISNSNMNNNMNNVSKNMSNSNKNMNNVSKNRSNNSISNSTVSEESEESSEGMPESVIDSEESSNSSSFPETESVESRD